MSDLLIKNTVCDTKMNQNRKTMQELIEKYGINKIKSILKDYPAMDKKIIKLYYGLDENKSLNVKNIANLLNINSSDVLNTIKRSVYNLPRELEAKKKANEEFYKMFEGYSKKEIRVGFEKMSSKTKEVLCYYYGLGSYPLLSAQEISKKRNTSYQNTYVLIKHNLTRLRIQMDVLRSVDEIMKLVHGFFNKNPHLW